MGNSFWAEWIFERFEHSRLQIEVPKIIIHKADQPDVVVHFFDADSLSGRDRAEVDFLLAQTDAPAVGDHNDFVVEGIVDIRQAGVGTRGRLVDVDVSLCWCLFQYDLSSVGMSTSLSA